MTEDWTLRPLLAVLISLLAALLIVVFRRRPNVRESCTLIAALGKFAMVFSLLADVNGGHYPHITLFEIAPGVGFALGVDSLGLSFALSASLLWIVTSIYSIGYMRTLAESHQTRYYASFAICLSATIGLAFAANLLTFLIFYEVLTIATYPLVVHKGSAEALATGRKYLAYLLSGGGALVLAVAWTHSLAPSLDFKAGGMLPAASAPMTLGLLFFLFVVGVGVKAGLMPLHGWLPSAMVAPTPVSALLHAVAVVKAGVFGLARVIGFVFGGDLLREIGAVNILATLAGLTIVLASLLAMAQNNLKRRLAYSTVGHLSYIVLGLALVTPEAWLGALFHIITHAAMKITLFFCAGAIYAKTHLENIDELDGIGRQMPITMGAFGLASLGLAGVPPLGGFVSKWFLAQGTLAAGQPWLLAILLLSGLLNAAYLLPIVVRAFFIPSERFPKFAEASPLMIVPLVTTALLALALGLFPDAVFHWFTLASDATTSVLAGGVK
ncbi:MAG: proton-conducting transporter transmembrane domain-containing protein [Candidatus Binatia bacterium]